MRGVSREIVASARREVLDEKMPEGDHQFAWECASVALEAFSRKHPEIVMSYETWMDLKEIIERSIQDLDPDPEE